MRRRDFLTLAALLGAAPAFAQTPGAAAPGGLTRVALQTGEGLILLELEVAKAPITAGNFLRYVDLKRYDGGTFYRASHAPTDPNVGLVQGGIAKTAASLPPIAHESTVQTGLSHKDGTLSIGRFKPGTATSDIFICCGDQPYLDADPKDPVGNPGFAAFGRVAEGMDVVRRILGAPLSATGGEGVMKGEMLASPVPILSARRAA